MTVFLDFDGTITTRDATDAILDAYAAQRFGTLRHEMGYYLTEFGVDAVITDNPDQGSLP